MDARSTISALVGASAGVHDVVLMCDSVSVPPLDDLRPACLVRTGGLTLWERLRASPSVRSVRCVVNAMHERLAREQLPAGAVVGAEESLSAGTLLLNARCPLPDERVFGLEGGEALSVSSDVLIAGRLASGTTAKAVGTVAWRVQRTCEEAMLLSRPWHARRGRDACLAVDLALAHRMYSPMVVPAGVTHLAGQDVLAHASARVCAGAILDSSQGAIVLCEQSVVRPGAIVIGPCWVGPGSTILERATIRAGTCVGPTCKVNGEVGGTIFQGLSNKAHDGYLGDAWVGEWVNLGAGTTVSNLLNTYGETIARATPEERNERTGEVFLGPTIGDHVKCAICTRLMTASVLHMGSMFATTAPVSGTMSGFSWATDAGISPFRIEKFLEVMRAAMSRRGMTPSEAYVEAVRAHAARWHARD